MCYDIHHMTLEEIEGCFALAQDGIPIGQQEVPKIQAEEQEAVTQEEPLSWVSARPVGEEHAPTGALQSILITLS